MGMRDIWLNVHFNAFNGDQVRVRFHIFYYHFIHLFTRRREKKPTCTFNLCIFSLFFCFLLCSTSSLFSFGRDKPKQCMAEKGNWCECEKEEIYNNEKKRKNKKKNHQISQTFFSSSNNINGNGSKQTKNSHSPR